MVIVLEQYAVRVVRNERDRCAACVGTCFLLVCTVVGAFTCSMSLCVLVWDTTSSPLPVAW